MSDRTCPVVCGWALLWVIGLSVLWSAQFPRPAHAETGITWEGVETVDQDVAELSSTADACAVRAGDAWHLFYCREGQVRRRVRAVGGWGPIEDVSTVAGAACNPHAELLGTNIVVVWEDDRTGIVEIWSRVWSGGAWSAEVCVTDDSTPSRAPALAALWDRVQLVWQDGEPGGQIFTRSYAAAWSPPMQLSQSGGSASEPTVCTFSEWEDEVCVAWTDTRLGRPQIFSRRGSGPWWTEEAPVMLLEGDCRHPACSSEIQGGDAWYTNPNLVFEHTPPGGVTEIWAACGEGFETVRQVSPADGIPSVLPAIATFRKTVRVCSDWGSAYHGMPVLTWTDLDGGRSHWVAEGRFCPSPDDGRDLISPAGLDRMGIAASEGSPRAPLLAFWIEESADGTSLLARPGSVPGCTRYGVDHAPRILLIPGGAPATTMRFIEECTGAPLSELAVRLVFTSELDQELTWDPAQPHPSVFSQADHEGWATFVLRGGGCSQAGAVYVRCDSGGEFHTWPGAKSPDITGDCAVEQDDVDTILSRIGTGDFCADLDGSGLVDTADVTFARSLLGSRCADPAALDMDDGAGGLVVRVAPNPCRERVMLEWRAPSVSGPVQILDVSGRLVRSFAAADYVAGADASGRLEWDLRDRQGRAIPSGVYWAVVASGGAQIRRCVVVLR